jgi:hypothetical protein
MGRPKSSGTTFNATALLSDSSAGQVGFAAGTGGAVTQATNRTTGVTLSKPCGAITTNNASLAAGAEATFTVTNTLVAATDVIALCLKTKSATALSIPFVSAVGAGSFDITLSNLDAATADTSASVINFVVLKGVAS